MNPQLTCEERAQELVDNTLQFPFSSATCPIGTCNGQMDLDVNNERGREFFTMEPNGVTRAWPVSLETFR